MAKLTWQHDPILVLTYQESYGIPRMVADFRWRGKRYNSDPEEALHDYDSAPYSEDRREPFDLCDLQLTHHGHDRWCERFSYVSANVDLDRLDAMKRTLTALHKGMERFNAAGQTSYGDQALYLAQACSIFGVQTFAYVPDPDVAARIREYGNLPSGYRLDNMSNLRSHVERLIKQVSEKRDKRYA